MHAGNATGATVKERIVEITDFRSLATSFGMGRREDCVSCLHDPPDAVYMYIYAYTGCLGRTIASNDTLGYIGYTIIAIAVYTEWRACL